MSFDRTGNVSLENPASVTAEAPNYTIPGTPGAASVTTITATGLATLNGGIACDTDKFTVADTSGDTAIGGTLAVTGAATLSSTLAVTGASTLTGAATLSSTLAVTGASTLTGAVTAAEAGGNITAKGYKVSDGGTVTQITSITTGVTLNTTTGQITTVSTTLGAGSAADIVVTNSVVAATSIVIVNIASTSSAGTPVVSVAAVGSGSFTIRLINHHASAALDNTLVINFAVFAGSAT